MGQPDYNKYLTASAIANETLRTLLSTVAQGVSVNELCAYGDELIRSYAKSVYRKDTGMEKGIAFPTTVSVNNIIQSYSPDPSMDYKLSEGDVVKIEVGAHIHGFIASSAHTTVVNSNVGVPITDRRADVICAAYYAAEAALRLFKPGNTNIDVMKAIQMVASGFGCNVVNDTFTAQIDQFVMHGLNTFVMHGLNTFVNKYDPEQQPQKLTFETDQVYTLDVVISTGKGSAKQGYLEPTIYQRDVNQKYSLKLRASRALFSEICTKYSVFPFLLREVADTKLKAGLSECVNHGLLVPFAVTSDEKGSFVAQFKLTVMSHYTGPIRLTEPQTMPHITSATSIPQDSEIGVILQQPFQQKKAPELPKLAAPPKAPTPYMQM
ncbi:hypothetical protein H4219_002193 [Mycoemilia scoparia]|uniref:Peptidase M24 domain-containing protein n=1 Tax=Mycoemilia scoparia TaxID=417184 RepID=A0A9W8A4S4_9FUNG|nr:hypothetical protein H4219_002193 [Mycoemilia scoparia]